jgi:hypothetical protein
VRDYRIMLKQRLAEGDPISKKPPPAAPSKPSKAASEGFEGDRPRGFSERAIASPPRHSEPFQSWDAEDWRAWYDERAGILEFDAGLPRPEAEARAYQAALIHWLDRNPARSPANVCAHCGGGAGPERPLLPFGAGDVSLHTQCWPEWHERRRRDATAALAAMEINEVPYAR